MRVGNERHLLRAPAPNGMRGRTFGRPIGERQFLQRLDAFCSRRYMDCMLDVTGMARHMAVSPRHLARRLNALTQQTPQEYLRQFRLRKAIALLIEGERVGMVADAVGFASHAHFSHCFRAYFGVTPSEYR